MLTVFADSGYWIALYNPHDGLHAKAKAITEQLEPFRIVTSHMVLVEFLNYMGGRGQNWRGKAGLIVRSLADDPSVEVIPQTGDQFDSAVTRYLNRLDKDWSLTDCASFVAMERWNISEALAHDHDFEQAGFVALLRDS